MQTLGLAGIGEKGALNKLPETERRVWQELWVEVAASLAGQIRPIILDGN